MYDRIVVGLKFSDSGKFALQQAAELARVHRAKLLVFHALDYHLCSPCADEVQKESELKTACSTFESQVRGLLGDFDNYEFICRPDDPAIGVMRTAVEHKADLIVMGCHSVGEGPCLARVDYTGMTVLEKSPCQVLLVPFEEKEDACTGSTAQCT
jgi:nucleotide-binding universal stress UspA family protein